MAQWQQFIPAMERESEQMQAIRNLATYARPTSGGVHEVSSKKLGVILAEGPDRSPFV